MNSAIILHINIHALFSALCFLDSGRDGGIDWPNENLEEDLVPASGCRAVACLDPRQAPVIGLSSGTCAWRLAVGGGVPISWAFPCRPYVLFRCSAVSSSLCSGLWHLVPVC